MTPTHAARIEADEEDNQTSGRRPEALIKVSNVEIAVWRNHGTGGDFYSASAPTIRYRDGEQWKDGSSYGVLDLLALGEAAREASAKIRELSRGRLHGR